ncbi:hypothetical protein EDC96DRAFT_179573 [Choanephora cucurbitarum]|nr:hypothetical protein EDC96DRAFT_179573 [Choanephora cucurbitarum]
MTLKKTNRGEMRLQSNIVPAICSIFKVSIAHAPQGCDHVIFKDYSHVKNCRPDYLVEVQEGEDFINAVGEIKCSSTAPKKVALDKYRLALFGVSMLWSFNLKNSMVFQVVGQQMKFYLCSQVGEIMLMLEVGSLVLPLTYEEYANFYTCIDHLYNVALLYEKHCGKNDEEAKKWELLDFDVVKSLFAISTSKTSTVNNEASSSTGDCL